jgi:hypothetical protein
MISTTNQPTMPKSPSSPPPLTISEEAELIADFLRSPTCKPHPRGFAIDFIESRSRILYVAQYGELSSAAFTNPTDMLRPNMLHSFFWLRGTDDTLAVAAAIRLAALQLVWRQGPFIHHHNQRHWTEAAAAAIERGVNP